MKRFQFVLFTLILFLSGCRVGPEYEPPCDDAPVAWKNGQDQGEGTEAYADYWWEIFDDPVLDDLELQAIANSPTLKIAYERVLEARAYAGIQASYLYPQLTLNPMYTNEGILTKNFVQKQLIREHMVMNNLTMNLNYEVDFWGKIYDRYISAYYEYEADEWDYQTSLLIMTTDIASNYFQLRALDSQIDLYKETIKSRRKSYQILKDRYEGHVINYSDVSRAALQLYNAETDYYDALRQRALQENQIAMLIGTPAPLFHLDHNPVITPPPVIPKGVPSDVLFQRPDILSAERDMASEHALIRAAVADFYPSLTLTGALGYSSPDLKHFLKWKSRFYSMGASVAQTLFDGGLKIFNLELADYRYGASANNYLKTVLEAYQEVEDALTNVEFFAKEQITLGESVKAAATTLKIAQDRYLNGVAVYLEVTTAEEDDLVSRSAYNRILGNRYIQTVQLIKALGGSWKNPENATGLVP